MGEFESLTDGYNYRLSTVCSIMKFGESQGKDESIATFGYCEFAGMIQLNEGKELVAGYVPRDFI